MLAEFLTLDQDKIKIVQLAYYDLPPVTNFMCFWIWMCDQTEAIACLSKGSTDGQGSSGKN